MTNAQLDELILEQIHTEEDFAADEHCQWETCQDTATHNLICPVCSSKELLCTPHAVMIQNARIGEVLVFNCTCDHRVLRTKCSVEPK